MRVAERIWGICEICVISVCCWTSPDAGPSFGTSAIPRLRGRCARAPLGMTAGRSAPNDDALWLTTHHTGVELGASSDSILSRRSYAELACGTHRTFPPDHRCDRGDDAGTGWHHPR